MADASLKISLLLKPGLEPDQELAFELEKALVARGHKVSRDRQKGLGLGWVQEVESSLRQADLVVAILSARSVQSEMLAYEIELADGLSSRQEGRPCLVPVRVQLPGVLPAPFDGLLRAHEFYWDEAQGRHRSRQLHWKSPADDAAVLAEIERRSAEAVEARRTKGGPGSGSRPIPLEGVGGAVPLDSQLYIQRETDGDFLAAVEARESLVLLKGARQMGKTSLLARGLQAARDAGRRVVLTDLQKLSAQALGSSRDFLMAVSELAARQLQLDLVWQRRWKNDRAPSVNFEDFWRRDVLGSNPQPTVWAIDEFDRVFDTPFATEVCGMLRAWHNERALDPSGPWREFTMAIAYATEVHLFIRDLNQSPFNVGCRLGLEDFTPDQVAELNRRHGSPLADDASLARLMACVGGHPFLVRVALRELSAPDATLAGFEGRAADESGPLGDHLRRLLLAVSRDPKLLAGVRRLVRGQGLAANSSEEFYRLRSAGVVVGVDPGDVRFRCGLYGQFLGRQLGAGGAG